MLGHLWLVVRVAAEYRGLGLPLNDLISEGNLGLMHATKETALIVTGSMAVALGLTLAVERWSGMTALGDVATVNRNLTPEIESLRRAVERDRYGLMAYVLVARDHCTPQNCPAFRSLGNSRQLMTNMDDRVYEGLVMRYSGSWGAPAALPPIADTVNPAQGSPLKGIVMLSAVYSDVADFDPVIAQPLNEYFLVGGNSWTDYGLPAVDEFVRAGYVVIGTDFGVDASQPDETKFICMAGEVQLTSSDPNVPGTVTCRAGTTVIVRRGHPQNARS